jgi:hypothetical protein
VNVSATTPFYLSVRAAGAREGVPVLSLVYWPGTGSAMPSPILCTWYCTKRLHPAPLCSTLVECIVRRVSDLIRLVQDKTGAGQDRSGMTCNCPWPAV